MVTVIALLCLVAPLCVYVGYFYGSGTRIRYQTFNTKQTIPNNSHLILTGKIFTISLFTHAF